MRTTRKMALNIARVAGYHDDRRAFTRAYIEAPVSMTAMQGSWEDGRRAKLAGVPCDCPNCRRESRS